MSHLMQGATGDAFAWGMESQKQGIPRLLWIRMFFDGLPAGTCSGRSGSWTHGDEKG